MTPATFRTFANELPNLDGFGDFSGELKEDAVIGSKVECIANATSGPIGEDGWMRLVVFGEHPNGAGDLQVFQSAESDAIVRRFRVAANAAVKLLFRTNPNRPVYYGHPDHPSFAANGHDDFTLRAEITDMETREDGLYIKPVFTDAGNALLQSGEKLYWSPRWVSVLKGRKNGRSIWAPFKLLSAGLTPTPNILGSAANSQPESNPKKHMKKILIKLGFTEDQANAFAESGEGAPTEAEIEQRLDAALIKADQANEALSTETAEHAQAKEQITALQADFANERKARASLIVEQAIIEKRMEPSKKEASINDLANAADFEQSASDLLKAEPILPSSGKTEDLGFRKGEMQDIANAKASFNDALADFANDQGYDLKADYSKTYRAFKKTTKGAELLKKMEATQGE